ncbi:hypothetical protein M758_1G247900 [Ceratodon purpureus]|nr:hypothetical protein M758_1G247900 [Ceratodon purpureus]
MAFLLKVFSGSERLREKHKSAALVNETFEAELNDVQTKLEVENYELQMLAEMIYDSSYPESQKFLKQPTKDRLHAHKETISSLLFGLAAQGISVAPLILTHFQKYGCDAIADTLISLLELVRPLLASKDIPEFTSDDILDAIDLQWHSSVRSSPAFGSLRGSTAPSPLQSPRVSFSNLSPGQSFSNLSPRQSFSNLSPRKSDSSPQSPFSMERMSGSSPGKIPSYRLTSPRKTQTFSFSPPSLPDTVREDARAAPPRRSLSSHYPDSDVGLSQSYGERLQPLAEHDEEINTGFGKFRKHDDGTPELLPIDGAYSSEKPSSHEAEENNVFSRSRPQSSSTSAAPDGCDGNDHAAEQNFKEFPTAGHNTLATVLPCSMSLNVNIEEFGKGLSINIPRSSISFAVDEPNGGQSVGKTQVAEGNAGVKRNRETTVAFLPLGRVGSRSNSLDESGLDFSHENFDKSVRNVDAEVPFEEFSTRIGGREDTAGNILESEVPVCDVFSSSNHERQIPEKDIVVSLSSLPSKRNNVDDSEQRVYEKNGEELNSTDNSLSFEEGIEEDRVGVVRMVDMPTPQVPIKTKLQSDECKEVQEAKDSQSHDSEFDESSVPTPDHVNVTVTNTDSPPAKEVEDGSLDVSELSSSVGSCEHDVQKELAPTRESHNEGEVIVSSSSSLIQGTNSENSIVQNNVASSPHDTEGGKFPQGEPYLSVPEAAVGELRPSSWSEKSASIQLENLEYTGDSKELEENIQNGMDNAEEGIGKFLLGTNNDGRDEAVDGVAGGGLVKAIEGDGSLELVDGDGAVDCLKRDGAVDGVNGVGAVDGRGGNEVKDGNSPIMLIPTSSVEDDSLLVSALIKDREANYSSPVERNEEFLVEKSSIQAEGEMEFQEQESTYPRGIVETGTDTLSQSSFSDGYDDGGDDESTSSSSDDISSSTSSSGDDISSSTSSENLRNSSSSDDESDAESSLPSARAQGIEETTPFVPVTFLHEDRDLSRVENGEHLSRSSSSGLLPIICEDANQAQKAEKTGLDEHARNPELNFEQGAELHTPSYNSVTFDLTKLSRNDNVDIASRSSLQSEGCAVPDVTSESTSLDDLGMTLANCLTANGPYPTSDSAASPNSVASEASLLSPCPHCEDGSSDAITSEVVSSSKINESENLCSPVNTDAGVSTDHAPGSIVATRSLSEQKDQDPEGPGVIHTVTLLSENVNEEADWKHLSENGTKELENPSHSDAELDVSGVEGETFLRNLSEAYLCIKDCELQSSQQLPIHGGSQQIDRVNDPLVSLSSDVVTHALLKEDYVENGLPSKESVQTESKIPFHTRVEESEGAELLVEEPSQRNEPFVVDAADFQMSHNASESFLRSEALSSDFGDSSAMENECTVSGDNEVNPSGDNHFQHAHDEEEKAVTTDSAKTDSEGFKSEDHLRDPEAEMGSGLKHSAEHPDDFEVTRHTDGEADSPSEQDDKEGVPGDQHGLNLATEHISNQLVSTKSEDEPASTNENDLQERATPGTSSSNLFSTVDEEGRNLLSDQVDEGHDTECKHIAEEIPSHFVHFVDKAEVNGFEMGEPKHVKEENPLPAQRGDMPVSSVSSSELTLFESQSKEYVLQIPEHDHSSLTGDNGAGVAGAICVTTSDICDGSMLYPMGHGHDEGKADKEKGLVVHVDDVLLPSQAQDTEGQDTKQVLDGVNFSNTKESSHGMAEENEAFGICDPTTDLQIGESETSRPSEYEDYKEMQAASAVHKLSAYGFESDCSKNRHPLEHNNEYSDMIPPAPKDAHSMKDMSTQFLTDTALLEEDEELPNKGTLLVESGGALFKNEEVGKDFKLSNVIQTQQLSDALTSEEADEWETNYKNEAQQVEKGSDTFLKPEEPAVEGMKEPILHTSERGMERDEKDDNMEFVTGSATYGVFLHNTKFFDSQSNFVRALTAPVIMARSTEVLQSEKERQSIHDSIICTPTSSDRSSRTHKNVRQRRSSFLRTWCYSCCSRPSAL